MNQLFLALTFQADDSSMWIILAVVLVILFFIVVIVAAGLTIFFIMRKRSKALQAPAQPDMSLSPGTGASDYSPGPTASDYSPGPSASDYAPGLTASDYSPGPSASDYAGMAQPETTQVVLEPDPAPPITGFAAPPFQDSPEVLSSTDESVFDPSRTVAIIRENTVAISYGSIKFTSGVLSGQQFEVEPEGVYLGRESTLSQIVVSDQRISKRHLWIGVRDGVVKIVDHDSRNGTFLNDPKSERITEAVLHAGDIVIMGESDVARFEYQA